MSSFREGWYEIAFDAKTRNSQCRYFRSVSFYTLECTVLGNGQQILRWYDPQGPRGPGRPGQWSSRFRPLDSTPQGDWWDNPRGQGGGAQAAQPSLPGAHARSARQPTPRELCQRAAGADPGSVDGLNCTKVIHVGLFFDGTNNNMVRDKPIEGHSNVVSLFEAHKDDGNENFAYYIPGVGTRFPEIGEQGEDKEGKGFAAGGEARIHYGMLQVYNAVCRAATKSILLSDEEMRTLATSMVRGLATAWRLGDGKMQRIFEEINARLMLAIEGKRPRVTQLSLSIFGFSRGAAEARAFNQWIQQATGMRVGTAALDVRFLGVFDTVASVFLADSSPVGGDGLFDWARNNMEIVGARRTVHYAAAHEIRRSFPLSKASNGASYASGVKEFVYPGAHSDIGGGYSPNDQGKARAGRSALLSQIALNDMYFEALNAGAALKVKGQLPAAVRADFAVDPGLERAFMAYAAWTKVVEAEDVAASGGAPSEGRMQYHMGLYWRWRAKVSEDSRFKALSSYVHAGAQDQVDLWESEQDWRADVRAAQEASKPTRRFHARVGYVDIPPKATDTQEQLLAQIAQAHTVSDAVSEFFDKYVHDSHAGFWLMGAQTPYDKGVLIAEIKANKKRYDELMAIHRNGDPMHSGVAYHMAQGYKLNHFEQRVLKTDATTPGEIPVITDADSADLRDNAGLASSIVFRLMGTATRREAGGHGRYRRVFNRSSLL
jgi:uncharacterized protein (DUF2235 family)